MSNGKGKYFRGIPDGIVLQPHHNLNQVLNKHEQIHNNLLCAQLCTEKKTIAIWFSFMWHQTITQVTNFPGIALQISQLGSDDTYLLPDLLQKTSSSSPTYNALSQQQRAHELSYLRSPTAPGSPTHQDLHVSSAEASLLTITVLSFSLRHSRVHVRCQIMRLMYK